MPNTLNEAGDGRLSVSVPIPDQFGLIGTTVLFQAITFAKDSGQAPMISNATVLVVKDH